MNRYPLCVKHSTILPHRNGQKAQLVKVNKLQHYLKVRSLIPCVGHSLTK